MTIIRTMIGGIMVEGCRRGLFLPRDTLDIGVGSNGMPFLHKAGRMEDDESNASMDGGIWFGVSCDCADE